MSTCCAAKLKTTKTLRCAVRTEARGSHSVSIVNWKTDATVTERLKQERQCWSKAGQRGSMILLRMLMMLPTDRLRSSSKIIEYIDRISTRCRQPHAQRSLPFVRSLLRKRSVGCAKGTSSVPSILYQIQCARAAHF